MRVLRLQGKDGGKVAGDTLSRGTLPKGTLPNDPPADETGDWLRDLMGPYADQLDTVTDNLWLQSGIIFAATITVALLFDWILTRVVLRWTRKTPTDFDDQLAKLFHRPIIQCAILAGLALAFLRLDIQSVWLEKFTLRVIGTLTLVILFGFSLRFCGVLLKLLSDHRERFHFVQVRTLPLFDNLAKIVVFGVVLYLLIKVWGGDITAWVASAGILGLALSFAAKDTLSNLFAGVFILADAPYKLGDFIILDSAERGRVTQIGLRSTRILTRDDIEITVPNAVIGNAKIMNESGGPHEKERVRIKIGVAYGSDIDLVQEVLLDVANGHDEICSDPAPRVRFRTFGPSSLDFELLTWIDEPILRGRLIHGLNCEVYKAFQDQGIEIPYAKQDIYIKELPITDNR